MAEPKKENLKPRPPVVVVMGHVDHGKTTLLDYIRKANVAAREAGGITQAVGAYEIIHGGRKITFIDTPGHEAFTDMRSRGAEAADLAILVIAAEESLKPQTEEAIKILQLAQTPLVVAINKIDKPGANVEKVKNDLTAAGVLLEGYGGSVSYQPISAKTGEGVDDLLDLVFLTADLEERTYDDSLPGSGFVLEARLDKRRGNEVSVILKNGTLRTGDEIGTASAQGKVKLLEDFTGTRVEKIEPSAPAFIVGFETLPRVGEEFRVGAKAESGAAQAMRREVIVPKKEGDRPVLRLVLKAKDSGSLEALSAVLKAMGSDEHPLFIIDESVGDIGDNDLKLAIASEATVIGFKTKTDKTALSLAETHHVRVIASDIVYELIHTVQEFLEKPEDIDILAELEVLAVFNKQKLNRQVIGGRVTRGIFRSKGNFEIRRANAKAGSGRITNLQNQKKDVNQLGEGNEGGLMVNADVEIQVGDALVVKK